ncbi:phosphatase PAP2 family protein [Rhodobacterales bacterium HKCCE3408]|nr:phosphatase PAP2 family protein [Rhodobacterales bacterium HKCCE3408]
MDWLKDLHWNRGLIAMILLVVVTSLVGPRTTEGVGDRLQVVLPLTGLGCAIVAGEGPRYTMRYIALTVTYNLSKHGLGETALNARPNGGFEGFPSGHTSVSAYGAAGIARTCLAANPPAQVAAGMAAGLVGGTRIDVGAHNVWQVLGGAILGWIFQVVAFTAFDAWARRAFAAMGRGIVSGARTVRDGVTRLTRL